MTSTQHKIWFLVTIILLVVANLAWLLPDHYFALYAMAIPLASISFHLFSWILVENGSMFGRFDWSVGMPINVAAFFVAIGFLAVGICGPVYRAEQQQEITEAQYDELAKEPCWMSRKAMEDDIIQRWEYDQIMIHRAKVNQTIKEVFDDSNIQKHKSRIKKGLDVK